MKIISFLISLFSVIKTKALECVSVANQKCMPIPKILDVNEGIGEPLFYPYKVLVNKCSGSCNTLDNPMSKISLRNKKIIDALDKVWSSIKDKINPSSKIKDYDKFRFNSDIDLPVNMIIEFRSLLINVSYVIEKDNEYYPEIYLDDCPYVKNSIY